MEGLSRSQPKTWVALRLRRSLCLCVLESSVFCVFCVFWRGCSGSGLGALALVAPGPGCSDVLALWLPGCPHPLTHQTPITCRHDGGPVPWCGVGRLMTVRPCCRWCSESERQPPLTWVPGWAPRTQAAPYPGRPVPRPPKNPPGPQEVWRARADHGRIACSCQPFHFWAVAHLGMTLPQPCPSETGQDRPCLRPRMGLFSIHRRLPAFQPSLLASSVMVTRAYYRNRNGSGQPNPTSLRSPVPLCHKLPQARMHPSAAPVAAPAVINCFRAGRSGRPPRHQRPAYSGSAASTTPTGPCPNDSARWRAGRVEMASKPERCIGHRGAKMG